MMLPQVSIVPMEADCENSLPPDICLESESSDPPTSTSPAGPWSGGANKSWPGDDLPQFNDSDANESAIASSRRSDLLSSNNIDEHEAGIVASLPDLCEGASANSRMLDHMEVEERPVTSECGGAKPKTKSFKYKVGNKSRSVCDKSIENNRASELQRTRENNEACSNNIGSEIPRFNFSENGIPESACLAVDEIPAINDVEMKSENEVIENLVLAVENEKSGPPCESNEASCDTNSSEVVPDLNSVTDCPENSPKSGSPAEEFLLHDSHHIGLLACGILNCDSEQQSLDKLQGMPSGLMLVRNNLVSASHPMFSKWPCEAYIPSHFLINVPFNSHGTSLGVSCVCFFFC